MAALGELGSFPAAIVNGRVMSMTGPPLERGAVLIENGRIRAVEPSAAVPEGARVIDAEGKWVLPGLVDSHAHVGLQEDVSEEPGDDLNETSSPDTSGLRVIDGIDIEDSAFRDALSGGITTVVVLPGSANPLSGESAALKTWGGRTIDEQIVRAPLGLKSGFGENPKAKHGGEGRMPMTRMGTALIVRQALEEARSYRAARHADGQSMRDLRLEALVRLLDGETTWAVHAHRHDDIVTAIRIADEFGLRLVVNHGGSSSITAPAHSASWMCWPSASFLFSSARSSRRARSSNWPSTPAPLPACCIRPACGSR